jgi:hypothetical protein
MDKKIRDAFAFFSDRRSFSIEFSQNWKVLWTVNLDTANRTSTSSIFVHRFVSIVLNSQAD